MPQYHQNEDMWDYLDQADLFLITTCATLNSRGELVMGAGIAKEAKARYPWLPRAAGDAMKNHPNYRGLNTTIYGVYELVHRVEQTGVRTLALLQTKYHWHDPAEISLIAYAIGCLRSMIRNHSVVAMPFPGIGTGGLPRAQVKPWVDLFPGNVHVFER